MTTFWAKTIKIHNSSGQFIWQRNTVIYTVHCFIIPSTRTVQQGYLQTTPKPRHSTTFHTHHHRYSKHSLILYNHLVNNKSRWMNKIKLGFQKAGTLITVITNCTAISVDRFPFDTNRKSNVASAQLHCNQRRPTSAWTVSVRDVHIDDPTQCTWQEDAKGCHYNLNSKTLLHIASLYIRILILTSFQIVYCNLTGSRNRKCIAIIILPHLPYEIMNIKKW